jgi:hypothetical protein
VVGSQRLTTCTYPPLPRWSPPQRSCSDEPLRFRGNAGQVSRSQARASAGTVPVPAWCLTSAPNLTCDNSAAGGTRTPDPLVRSQVLYPLSYSRILLIRTDALSVELRAPLNQMFYPLELTSVYLATLTCAFAARATVAGWAASVQDHLIRGSGDHPVIRDA